MHFIAHLMHFDPSLFGSFPVGDFFLIPFLFTFLLSFFHLLSKHKILQCFTKLEHIPTFLGNATSTGFLHCFVVLHRKKEMAPFAFLLKK